MLSATWGDPCGQCFTSCSQVLAGTTELFVHKKTDVGHPGRPWATFATASRMSPATGESPPGTKRLGSHCGLAGHNGRAGDVTQSSGSEYRGAVSEPRPSC